MQAVTAFVDNQAGPMQHGASLKGEKQHKAIRKGDAVATGKQVTAARKPQPIQAKYRGASPASQVVQF